jgi:hypothetical protein
MSEPERLRLSPKARELLGRLRRLSRTPASPQAYIEAGLEGLVREYEQGRAK